MALRRFVIDSNRFGEMGPRLREMLRDVAFVAATNIVDRATDSMTGTKSGREYRVPGTKSAIHRASAPGEAPAVLFGQLMASFGVEQTGETEFVAYTDDPKAPHLEFGTSRMEPRPFFLPAAEAERPEYEAAVANALERLS